MNTRATYNATRDSIRTNGLAYTTRSAVDAGAMLEVTICDALCNILKGTDWLALRARWATTGTTGDAFRLTTSDAILQRAAAATTSKATK